MSSESPVSRLLCDVCKSQDACVLLTMALDDDHSVESPPWLRELRETRETMGVHEGKELLAVNFCESCARQQSLPESVL